ncbi:MAG: aspartate kinase [Thauera sp.]|nr:aspartate kinase [Thauera sp.]
MHVVKLGGSLARDPLLPHWVKLFAEHGGGHVVIVPGGGPFADAARDAQAAWPLNDVTAHNMAILGMAQFGYLLQGLCPTLVTARNVAEVEVVLENGKVAVWLPFDLLREAPDELTSWDVTSDSLALWLAARLGAAHVALVKSCAIPANQEWDAMTEAGIVDPRFTSWLNTFSCRVTLLERQDVSLFKGEILSRSDSC